MRWLFASALPGLRRTPSGAARVDGGRPVAQPGPPRLEPVVLLASASENKILEHSSANSCTDI
jgi:hypothetical protein